MSGSNGGGFGPEAIIQWARQELEYSPHLSGRDRSLLMPPSDSFKPLCSSPASADLFRFLVSRVKSSRNIAAFRSHASLSGDGGGDGCTPKHQLLRERQELQAQVHQARQSVARERLRNEELQSAVRDILLLQERSQKSRLLNARNVALKLALIDKYKSQSSQMQSLAVAVEGSTKSSSGGSKSKANLVSILRSLEKCHSVSDFEDALSTLESRDVDIAQLQSFATARFREIESQYRNHQSTTTRPSPVSSIDSCMHELRRACVRRHQELVVLQRKVSAAVSECDSKVQRLLLLIRSKHSDDAQLQSAYCKQYLELHGKLAFVEHYRKLLHGMTIVKHDLKQSSVAGVHESRLEFEKQLDSLHVVPQSILDGFIYQSSLHAFIEELKGDITRYQSSISEANMVRVERQKHIGNLAKNIELFNQCQPDRFNMCTLSDGASLPIFHLSINQRPLMGDVCDKAVSVLLEKPDQLFPKVFDLMLKRMYDKYAAQEYEEREDGLNMELKSQMHHASETIKQFLGQDKSFKSTRLLLEWLRDTNFSLNAARRVQNVDKLKEIMANKERIEAKIESIKKIRIDSLEIEQRISKDANGIH